MKQQHRKSMMSYILIIVVNTAMTDTYNGAWFLPLYLKDE